MTPIQESIKSVQNMLAEISDMDDISSRKRKGAYSEVILELYRLLPKEKEVIEQAFDEGQKSFSHTEGVHDLSGTFCNNGKDYFNKTFNNGE